MAFSSRIETDLYHVIDLFSYVKIVFSCRSKYLGLLSKIAVVSYSSIFLFPLAGGDNRYFFNDFQRFPSIFFAGRSDCRVSAEVRDPFSRGVVRLFFFLLRLLSAGRLLGN